MENPIFQALRVHHKIKPSIDSGVGGTKGKGKRDDFEQEHMEFLKKMLLPLLSNLGLPVDRLPEVCTINFRQLQFIYFLKITSKKINRFIFLEVIF